MPPLDGRYTHYYLPPYGAEPMLVSRFVRLTWVCVLLLLSACAGSTQVRGRPPVAPAGVKYWANDSVRHHTNYPLHLGAEALSEPAIRAALRQPHEVQLHCEWIPGEGPNSKREFESAGRPIRAIGWLASDPLYEAVLQTLVDAMDRGRWDRCTDGLLREVGPAGTSAFFVLSCILGNPGPEVPGVGGLLASIATFYFWEDEGRPRVGLFHETNVDWVFLLTREDSQRLIAAVDRLFR